ncbi:ClbS/DfsB family four-helix bundle protein [Bauldia sp.]|uniref:ClbS/DfsB family four-helix bundle protein n=1 Tax=Bauldia sp. TaxID=2575872 RepID=UPI003BA88A7C
MAATSKADLLALSEKEFAKLQAALDGIDADLAATPHPDDDITIKDTVLHRVHWIGLFLGWYRDGVAGKTVETPAPGIKWNQLKAYNAKVREETRDVAWPEARKCLEKAHRDLMACLKDIDEKTLYGTGIYDWTNKWTVGRWAESSGPSHYRSATKYIREIVRKTTASR